MLFFSEPQVSYRAPSALPHNFSSGVCSSYLPYFQPLPHSLHAMERCNPFPINHLRTLSHSTEACGPLSARSSSARIRENLQPTKFRIFFQVPYTATPLFSHSSQNCRGGGLRNAYHPQVLLQLQPFLLSAFYLLHCLVLFGFQIPVHDSRLLI